MNAFIQTTPIALTPLTPIHIGCGEDFEPTNYVIDDGVLYHFDPARLPLQKADRDALLAASNKRGDEAIRDVQRFFHARKEKFAGIAHGVVAVAAGVARQYNERVGQVAQHESGGKRVANQLVIERTAHHPHSGAPYIPGSSIKGAIRTAWLDQLNRGEGKQATEKGAQDIEKRLLDSQGGFHADPFRLLRIADTSSGDVQARIVFATNHKKREVYDKDGRLVVAKGPATRREAIAGGQYRALAGEIRFDTLRSKHDPRRTPAPAQRIPGFAELAKACNRYYVKRLRELIRILDGRRFSAPEWLCALQALLNRLQPRFDDGSLMLLRVGRHSGAENVTLDGVRSIRIMKGKGQPPDWSPDGAKTVWLAAEREEDRSGMLPFGWLIVEPATDAADDALRDWCSTQPRTDLADIKDRLTAAREHAGKEAERQRQLEVERQARAQAEAAEQAAREAARATLSPQGLLIDDFVAACKAKGGSKDPYTPGSGLFAKASALSKAALADDSVWSGAERLQLADAFDDWLPKIIDKLDRPNEWKDARKKLRLAALRGE